MFEIIDICQSRPYKLFLKHLNNANLSNQDAIDAISICSFDNGKKEVDSRYVNLKYIINDSWIFFSNYKSSKANQFLSHNQIAASFFWSSINVQVRIKAYIKKTDSNFSDQHFNNREIEKNALSISSYQSEKISSYEEVIKRYEKTKKNSYKNESRPSYWGGYCFKPYYFEFWEGNSSRINKREVFELDGNIWNHFFLQP